VIIVEQGRFLINAHQGI